MTACRARVRAMRLTVVLACSLVVAPAAWAGEPASPAKTRYAQIRAICPPPKPGHATCTALLRVPVASAATTTAGVTPYTVNDGASFSGPAGGLTPAQLASAYDYEPTAGGTGQSVAIVDAYDDPNIEEDLETFDSHYGLAPCTTANGCFEKVGQTGSPKLLPEADTTGWSVEISLDVETVHAVCQKCKILLVEANEPSYRDLAEAVDEAVSKGATEVSNSYAGPEIGQGATEQAAYKHAGVVIAAATGDDGYDDWDLVNEGYEAVEMPNTPASLPSVVAVGGTSLKLNSNGTRAKETVWNNNGPGDEIGLSNQFPEGATGGGCSTVFTAPLWQKSAQGFAATGCGTKRLAADISAVADPDTGFDIYDTYDCGLECELSGIGEGAGWLTIGGTSLSTPLVTSLYALAGGSGGVSYPALTLYGRLADASSLFDVTEGGNGFCDAESPSECDHPKSPNTSFGRVDCEGTTACDAAPGLDGPSGVGTPNGLAAFKPLFPTAVVTPPGTLVAGTPAAFSSAASSDPYPGGAISAWSWNWGDGTPESHEADPTYAYAAGGEHTVSLTVTDNYGLTSVVSKKPVHVLTEAAAKKKHEEEEAAAKKKHEEEAEAKQKHEEEAEAKKKHEEEAEAATKASVSPAVQGVSGFQTGLAAPVPDAQLASTSLRVSPLGAVTVKISCPAGESRCTGSATLRTLGAVTAGVAEAAGRAVLILTKGPFTAAGGRVSAVTLHLSAKARALLAHLHVLRARATIVAHDLAGATHTGQAIVTLWPAKARHGKG